MSMKFWEKIYVESRLLALVQPMKKTNAIKGPQTHEREN